MARTLMLLAFLFSATTALAADQNTVTSEPTMNGKFRIAADWTSLKRGWNNLAFEISNSDTQKLEGAQVQFAYDMASHPMNPPAAVVTEKGAGVYEAKIFLGMRGNWRFNISIAKDLIQDDFERVATAN